MLCFFKTNTHLHITEGGVLKGSDNIDDYPNVPSRIEGQSMNYFAALVNAFRIDSFTISGKGTIDGNGPKILASLLAKNAKKIPNVQTSKFGDRAWFLFGIVTMFKYKM